MNKRTLLLFFWITLSFVLVGAIALILQPAIDVPR